MTALGAVQDTIEDPRLLLMDTVQDGVDALAEERDAFLTGKYADLAAIAERKLAVLAKLEGLIPQVERSARVLEAMNRLITDSRRNEEIIQAARQGLAHARRRLAAVQKMRSGAVAYAEDGSTIMSRADGFKSAKSA